MTLTSKQVVDAMPTLLRDYVNEICTTTDADPIMILTSVLGSISGIIRKGCCISERTYFERLYPNIWTLTIAPSGEFKSTALKKGGKLAEEHDKNHMENIAEIEQEIKTKQTGDRTEDLIEERQKLATLPNRVTTEALLQRLAEGCGGTLFVNEFAEFIGNLEKKHNNELKQIFTTFYDCPPHFSTATKTQGSYTIREPFVSLISVSTMAWVKETQQKDDLKSGFYARFLFMYPPQEEKVPAFLPQGKIQRTDTYKEKIYDLLVGKLPEGQREYGISKEAQEVLEKKHHELYELQRDRELLSPFVKRWSPYLLKLGMLLQPLVDPTSEEIGQEAARGACAIIDYASQSTIELLDKDLGESEFERKSRKVLEYIQRQGGEVAWKKLLQSKQLEHGALEYKEVMAHLQEAGKIEPANEKAGSRKDQTFRVVE